MNQPGKVVVIAGPSGSGKNSILEGVLSQFTQCERLVTATTREKRDGEVDGVDYYFFTKEQFLQEVEQGNIPEYWHAPETDRYYGTYLPDLEQKLTEGKTVIAHLQVEGLRFFRENYDALGIFIVPDSLDELRRRILHRQNMSNEELEERLKGAEKEMNDQAPEYDYVIVNKRDKLGEAISEVVDILRKEQYL